MQVPPTSCPSLPPVPCNVPGPVSISGGLHRFRIGYQLPGRVRFDQRAAGNLDRPQLSLFQQLIDRGLADAEHKAGVGDAVGERFGTGRGGIHSWGSVEAVANEPPYIPSCCSLHRGTKGLLRCPGTIGHPECPAPHRDDFAFFRAIRFKCCPTAATSGVSPVMNGIMLATNRGTGPSLDRPNRTVGLLGRIATMKK
jgi:hypothetical protein